DGKLRRVCHASETRSIDNVIAYPNPVPRGETLQLKLPETFVGGVLNIYDIKGSLRKLGLPLPATVNSINVSDLDSGIYLMHVFSKDGNRREIKLIIE
ncbi:MAG: T9SS type A sorting domain-containing protein, partial [Prevotellaceae bacterium]|nr:T9SS type A sorting domain-containing protein [Prevotellaceae bacterium]